jgi:hypothetical protein
MQFRDESMFAFDTSEHAWAQLTALAYLYRITFALWLPSQYETEGSSNVGIENLRNLNISVVFST